MVLTRCASTDGTGGTPAPAPNAAAADATASSARRTSPLTSCGNGVCEQGESAQTCPPDCAIAADATIDITPGDSLPAGNTGCFATNTPKCNGCACETCVCAMDSYCCQTAWDAQCASECANSCNGQCASTCGNGKCDPGETAVACPVDCSTTTGAGCTATTTPGCKGCACESCVCAMDSYCCQVSWDAQCVGECSTSCGGCKASMCGDGKCDSGETATSCPADCTATSGDGCTATNKPGCNGCGCEKCVCAMDSYCCSTAWDAQCVAECADKCGGTCTLGKCGDGNCDANETHDNCPQDCGKLVQCIEQDCGKQWLACQTSPGCQDYTACRALCGTKTACADTCQANASAVDLALFATLEQCAGATCLPEAATCSLAQNKCNGLVLTYCGPQGQMVTATCDDACAKDGFGPATSCGKNEAGIDRCFCQNAPPPGACTTQQNKCNGNELTWCDSTTGKLTKTTCTDKLCQDAGFGSLDSCSKGSNGYDICVCKPKP